MTVGALVDKSETPRLRFNSQQDAFDFTSQCVEDGSRFIASNNLDFVERYIKSELDIVVKLLSVRSDCHDYDLILSSIPDRLLRNTHESESLEVKSGPRTNNTNGGEHLMLVSVANLVQSVEQVIPSFVRLEPTKERENVLRKILGSSFDLVFKVSGTFGKGESAVPGDSFGQKQ